MYKIIRQFLFFLTVFSFIAGCAKRGTPVGGPKDVDPPKVLMTTPANNVVNYTPDKEIKISFDEYIVLKDANQEIVISPPLDERLNAMVNNKNVIVKFPPDANFDATTYTINFGKSIADNNEGNILNNYEFVFSLKEYIDSLNIDGHIINSFDLKPEKERFFVMLYNNLSDSAPIKEKPKFIARTDEDGNFSLHNIEKGTYRLFALKDINNNLKFDLPEELIAFSDSMIYLYPEKLINDTIKPENKPLKPFIAEKTTAAKNKATKPAVPDTAKTDSIFKPRKNTLRQELRFFKEIPKNQYLTNSLRTRPELLVFTFNQTLDEPLKIEPINSPVINEWYIQDINKNLDTVKYWITDTSMFSKDSLQFKITYLVYDSTGSLISKTDSLFLNYVAKEEKSSKEKKRRRSEDMSEDTTIHPVKKLALVNNIKNKTTFDLNGIIEYSSETPIDTIKSLKIEVFKLEDTLQIPLKNISIEKKSLNSFAINFKPEEQTQYKILIPDSTVFDIYGIANDTNIFSLKTQSEVYYGILTMHLKNIDGPAIVQLMDEKEIVVRENIISGDESIRYEYLYPKNYIIKLIKDTNSNGKWDTGKYLEHRQPEKVFYYPQVINVRSNWEIDLNWEVKD